MSYTEESDECYYPLTIDHSKDVEIKTSEDGTKIFAIKNIRQEFKGDNMVLKADISGDKEEANKYLKRLGEMMVNMIK